ncbi:hypothetical protein FC83_GL000309 [Agrilactobacillus composti DSM 18527 = JCM 14202]|uniref:Phosphoesterase n=1 Tax=Agrilactobacillus composti DSM 18527 = JCM 14202 TaxID=1423734 RepID=X0PQ74_9LACO|nr:metallophosphoesterase [Agrilactobacillus composti]KRM32445.1 hypothetical protein FC83_GL000309 [Agrilactobacillus composti DSM 18527 = JCM 14202]GAF39867.1 phosphoesterase [Agrilactobacillus composti DSM 18527 = JCM 14202]
MKYLVVSDNHGDQEILKTLLDHYSASVTAFIHCGDSELDYHDPLVARMTAIVQGNMDFDREFPITAQLQFGADHIFVTHGHHYGVNLGLDHLLAVAKEAGANFAFYGHTHQLACEYTQGVFMLNPGSISQPRGQYANLGGTYALVDSQAKKIVVDYYDRQLAKVPALHFEFNR